MVILRKRKTFNEAAVQFSNFDEIPKILAKNRVFRKIQEVGNANGYRVSFAYWKIDSHDNSRSFRWGCEPLQHSTFHYSVDVKSNSNRVQVFAKQYGGGPFSDSELKTLLKDTQESINFVKFLLTVDFNALPELSMVE